MPELKPEMRETLDRFGINESVIFPDVDGVSRYINWHTTLMVREDTEA